MPVTILLIEDEADVVDLVRLNLHRAGLGVSVAMNGWDEGQPAWWRNLEAHPDAVIRFATRAAAPGARTPCGGRGT